MKTRPTSVKDTQPNLFYMYLLNYAFRLEKILCTFYIIQCSVNCDDYAPSIVTSMHRREQTIYLQLINKKRKK
jgi:hypothetical protein